MPPGKVTAALTFLPPAFFASNAALNGVLSRPIFRSRYSSPTEMHCPARLSRARIDMGTGWLFGVTMPALIR